MPLPRPTAVSNLNIASIASVPARITLRGAGRSGSTAKPCGPARLAVRLELRQDRVGAVDGLQVPAQRQHVTPIAVGVKQGFQHTVVGGCECIFELSQPVIGGDRDIVGLVEHPRFSWPLPLRRSLWGNSLHPFGSSLRKAVTKCRSYRH